jgi:hypothetical protein
MAHEGIAVRTTLRLFQIGTRVSERFGRKLRQTGAAAALSRRALGLDYLATGMTALLRMIDERLASQPVDAC